MLQNVYISFFNAEEIIIYNIIRSDKSLPYKVKN